MKRLIPILSLLLLLTACENAVEPVVEDAEVRYAVYGFLDMRTDHQVIRVEALRPTILAEGDELDGVQVMVVEEGTGTRHLFRDSTGVATDGSPVSLFVADFVPTAGRNYRLEVGRPDESPTVATTRVPEVPILQFGLTTGTADDLSQILYLISVNGAPEAVTLFYTVLVPGEDDPVTIPINYGRLVQSPVSDLNFPVEYFSDRYIIMNTLRLDADTPGVRLQKIEMSLDLPSVEWTRVQPGNILRGHGFFASVGRYRYTWQLDRPSVEILGWIDGQ